MCLLQLLCHFKIHWCKPGTRWCLKHLIRYHESTHFLVCLCLNVQEAFDSLQKPHSCISRESKGQMHGIKEESFPEVTCTSMVTTPDIASCSPSLRPLSGKHCVQTAALLPFKTWDKQQVKLLKSCHRCSSTKSLFLSVTSLPQLTLSESKSETNTCAFAFLVEMNAN